MSSLASEMFPALYDQGEREFREGLVALREATASQTPHNAYLSTVTGLLHETGLDRDTLCSLLAFASLALIEEQAVLAKTLSNWEEMTESAVDRYRLAWISARGRALDHLAALEESDEERDFLRAQLKERDDEVAQLVARLAEYTGITS